MPNSPSNPASRTLLVSGVTHREGGLDLRERLAVADEQTSILLDRCLDCTSIAEAVVVSTCNRVEVVTVSGDDPSAVETAERHIEELLAGLSGIPRAELQPVLFHLSGEEAARHVFRVAAGLDSMVVGEPQILGQVKQAFEAARKHGSTAVILNRLFHRAFGVAKQVRHQTNIGRHAVSVCYAARVLAEHIFEELSKVSVLLFGAGEMGALALRHFRSAGATQVYVCARSYESSLRLASAFDAIPLTGDQAQSILPTADVVLGAAQTLNGQPIIAAEAVARAQNNRKGKAQFFVDLGVPRNFDPAIRDEANVFLYNIDDLQSVVDENLQARQLETAQAELFVEEEVRRFERWLDARALAPLIAEVRSKHRDALAVELAKTSKRLNRIAPGAIAEAELTAALESFGRGLLSKVIHHPLVLLKRRGPQDEHFLETFRDLFVRAGVDDESGEGDG
ncbi:MAG: glutamyl-tRNA reductase [Bdellovibrionales bacterium]|nr:glutamyl-tRNA reductase [Bdellovibrionales bacterium]